jgi:hypothetical protein
VADDESPAMQALKTLRDAFTGRIDQSLAKEALEEVLKNYELQLRVFLVGVAKGKIDRVIRMMNFLERAEEAMFSDANIANATPNQLIKMVALGQSSLLTSLDYIRKVADMRAEIERMGAASRLDEALAKATELGSPDGLPILEPKQRERIRGMLSRIVAKTIDVETTLPVKDGDGPSN